MSCQANAQHKPSDGGAWDEISVLLPIIQDDPFDIHNNIYIITFSFIVHIFTEFVLYTATLNVYENVVYHKLLQHYVISQLN